MRGVILRLGVVLSLMPLLVSAPRGVLILCDGADGHLALEFAQPDAAGHHDSAGAAVSAACFCDTGCGPCEDTEVDFGPSLRSSSDRRFEADVPATVAPWVAEATNASVRGACSAGSSPRPAPCSRSLLEQATTRLLI